MITTTKGLMDEALLEKREGRDPKSDDRADIDFVEYWLDGELVHRSAHITIKQGVEFKMELGEFN